MLDWPAAGFELLGVWLVGNKNRWAFPCFWICEAIWTVVAIQKQLWGLLALMVIMAVLNIRNYRKWGKGA